MIHKALADISTTIKATNISGRYEYTVLESMWKAVDVLRQINRLNVERNK